MGFLGEGNCSYHGAKMDTIIFSNRLEISFECLGWGARVREAGCLCLGEGRGCYQSLMKALSCFQWLGLNLFSNEN